MIQTKLLGCGDNFPELNSLLKELSPNTEPVTENDLERYLENPDCYIYIALDSEKDHPNNVVGMATIVFIWKCSGWQAEIHDVVVAPAYRGKRIGDKLMKELLDTARCVQAGEEKKITIYLTSKPHRVAANNMYLRHGFKLVAKAEGEEGTNLYKLIVEPSAGTEKKRGHLGTFFATVNDIPD